MPALLVLYDRPVDTAGPCKCLAETQHFEIKHGGLLEDRN